MRGALAQDVFIEFPSAWHAFLLLFQVFTLKPIAHAPEADIKAPCSFGLAAAVLHKGHHFLRKSRL